MFNVCISCLTRTLRPIIRSKQHFNKLSFLLPALVLCIDISHAQNVDCATATTICNDPITMGNPSGMGMNDFEPPGNDPGCLQNESANSSWYYFEFDSSTPPGSIFGFIISPAGGKGEDYDWALYGPDVGCAGLGTPIRCSSSSESCGFCPQTGMGMGATDFSEGPGTGDGFVATLAVQPGQGYFLNINNWKGTGNGFSLEFTGDAAEFLDCGADPPCSLIATALPEKITKCQGDPDFTMSATAFGGLAPYTFMWSGTGNGTGFLDDPDSENPNGTIPPDFAGSITYTVTVSDSKCEATDMVELVVNPKPVVTIEQPPKLCSNGAIYSLIGTPSTGTWGGIASLNGKIDPSKLPSGTYQATLSYTNSFGCSDMATVDIEIIDPVEINVDPIPAQCINNPAFVITPDPSGGQWSGNIDPDGEFNPAKFGLGSHTAIYTYYSPEGCKSETSVIIDVIDLPDIDITDPGILCADETIVPLSASPAGGTWSGVADPVGNVYPNQLGAGTFKVYYSFTDNEGCNNIDSILITVVTPPSAILEQAVTVCNSNVSGDNTLIDFNTLIISGDAGGNWADLNNSGATGNYPVLNFNGVIPGTYTFQYVTQSAQGNCKEFTGTVEIIVLDCSCPGTAIKSPGTFCTDNAEFDLDQYKITTEPGSWKINITPGGPNPATILGTTFKGTGKDPGTYTIQFTLANPAGGNCPESSTTTVTLVSPPFAILPSTINVCNQTGSGSYPIIIDLKSYISAGDKSGNWKDLNNSGANGSFNNLDFSGVSPGQYVFEYTTASATAPCKDQVYTVTVQVSDCNCPDITFNPAPKICQDNGTIDLINIQGNSAPGIWSIKNTPGGNNAASIQGNYFISQSSDPGIYTLQYTLTNPVAGCTDSKEIQVEVVALPVATVTSTAQVCNSQGNGNFITTIDFSTLVTGGDKNGVWSDISNSGAIGSFPTLDFTGIAPGTYTFRYTTNSALNPCPEVSYNVVITVKNCECPDISLTPSTDIRNDIASFDLSSLLITNEAGTWSVIASPSGGKPLTLNGNVLTIDHATPGSYTLQYSLSNIPPAGCPSSNTCILNILNAANAGTVLNDLSICKGTKQTVSLADLLVNEDTGGKWQSDPSSAQPGTNFDATTGSLICDNLPAGTYTFDYIVSGTLPCSDKTSKVNVIIHELPLVNAGQDKTINCNATSVILDPIVSTGGNIKINWTGPGISDPDILIQNVNKSGIYILEALDKNSGCKASDTLEVKMEGEPITDVIFTVKNTSCPGIDDGSISIDAIKGGTPDYSISLNGTNGGNSLVFPDLSSGNYILQVTDANGCSYKANITIEQGEALTIDLGPDLHLLEGDKYNISYKASKSVNQIISIVWTPEVCQGCQSFEAIAAKDITYQLQIEDKYGCKANDEITIFVKKVRKVYIPNVFSPDADGINDNFIIYSDTGIKQIKSLRIYNRWGGLLFDAKNFPPNDPKYGWNGKFEGKRLDNGVYVFVAEIEFTDNETAIYKGDITISR